MPTYRDKDKEIENLRKDLEDERSKRSQTEELIRRLKLQLNQNLVEAAQSKAEAAQSKADAARLKESLERLTKSLKELDDALTVENNAESGMVVIDENTSVRADSVWLFKIVERPDPEKGQYDLELNGQPAVANPDRQYLRHICAEIKKVASAAQSKG
jgi:hypothetical protein